MIPRGILDIEWPTLIAAAARSFVSFPDAQEASHKVEQLWDSRHPCLVSQSVRSGLDAVLHSVAWPLGSEILMSAVTIPEMARIVQEHGLVPVPVDVDPQTLAPDLDQLQERFTPRTRAVLVAHLFGSRLDLSELSRIVRAHEVALWEDVAQGFAADGFAGDALADISFFSFGMIKAQTSLGGAIVRFRDPALAARCRTTQAQWPAQATKVFRRRIFRSMMLRLLSYRAVLTIASSSASSAGLDFDAWLSRSTRGFDQAAFFEQLRQRPCGALVGLLYRRLTHPDRLWLERKTALAEDYCKHLPSHVLLGSQANFPSRWMMPVLSRDPQQLEARLKKNGFDATRRASQMRVIPASTAHPEWNNPRADRWVSKLVFLPLHPALHAKHIATIASIVNELEAVQGPIA